MKKILHIVTGLSQGGAEHALLNFCKFDQSCEHEVWVLKSEEFYSNSLVETGTKIVYLNLSLKSIISVFPYIKKKLGEEEYSLVMTWLYHADLFSVFIKLINSKIPIFWTIHNLKVGFKDLKIGTHIVFLVNRTLSFFVPHRIVYCAKASRIYHEKRGFCKKKGNLI